MRTLACVLLAALGVPAEPARATLRTFPSDRAVAVRAPSSTAVLRVTPRGGARATLEVLPDETGYWRLDALSLAGGALLTVAGEVFLDLLPAAEGAAPGFPVYLEAGDVAIEVPAPAADAVDPGGCGLRLEQGETSIRQDFAGADVFICGEGPGARAVFLGHIAPDQAGPARATLVTSAGETPWNTTVYSWRWTAERATVTCGEEARFALEFEGLPPGAEVDLTLTTPSTLQLQSAPGTFTSAGPGRWRARVRPGTFVFQSSTEGPCPVTAELAPCAR